jgi:peptide deformylase
VHPFTSPSLAEWREKKIKVTYKNETLQKQSSQAKGLVILVMLSQMHMIVTI